MTFADSFAVVCGHLPPLVKTIKSTNWKRTFGCVWVSFAIMLLLLRAQTAGASLATASIFPFCFIKAAATELEVFPKNIDHNKDIVAMQQSYAKISDVTETINVSEPVEGALQMIADALDRKWGGSLSVQSESSQQGATFMLALPLQPPKAKP